MYELHLGALVYGKPGGRKKLLMVKACLIRNSRRLKRWVGQIFKGIQAPEDVLSNLMSGCPTILDSS